MKNKKHCVSRYPVSVFIVTALLICSIAAALLVGCGAKDEALVFENAAYTIDYEMDTDTGEVTQDEQKIYVYVCGSVKTPGVYELPAGSRINDALCAAGGFAEDAAEEVINLAEPLKDGDKIYFPGKEEAEAGQTYEEASDDGLIDINSADATLLCTLPGIGDSKANDIISYRNLNGPFETVEDIMKVPGIKNAAYMKICDKITVK